LNSLILRTLSFVVESFSIVTSRGSQYGYALQKTMRFAVTIIHGIGRSKIYRNIYREFGFMRPVDLGTGGQMEHMFRGMRTSGNRIDL
jgi:hypothetical protein